MLAVDCLENFLSTDALSFCSWKCYWFLCQYLSLQKLFCDIISITVLTVVVVKIQGPQFWHLFIF
jgi:hypothetical protein